MLSRVRAGAMKGFARAMGTVIAVVALGLVLAHEANAFAPHHEDGDHHCCLCDAAIGIDPVAVPIVQPALAVARVAWRDARLAAPILARADTSRAPPAA